MKNAHVGSPIITFALLVLGAAGSGCGASPYNENAAAAPGVGNVPGASTPSPGSTYDPNLRDPYRFDFRVAGTTSPPRGQSRPGSTSQTISGIFTDNKLKVTVTGGDPRSIPGTGWTSAFSCLRVQVAVLGQTQTAFVTNTGVAGWGACQGAQPSQTLDFSNRVTQGHTAVIVQIGQAMSDNCYGAYGNPYAYGCPMRPVYYDHFVSGQIAVSVSGTN